MNLHSSLWLLCTLASLSSGTSPLTNYANFWEEELESGDVELEQETFMGAKEYDSQISFSVNPGCKYRNCTMPKGPSVTLVNLTVSDTPVQPVQYHWLWSVIGHPTLQAAVTEPGDQIKIKWSSIFGLGPLDDAIQYENRPLYSGAIMLLNLIEYNDNNNTGVLTKIKKEDQITFPLTGFFWERKVIENSTSRVSIQFIGVNYTTNGTNNLEGKINITISGFADDGYGSWLPHLCHSQRTNQMDIQLDHLESDSGFNQSRFALEFVVVSDVEIYDRQSNLTWQTTTTLDDEHTPGIFKTEELVIPGKNKSLQSYLQWRPVVYTTTVRDLSESTGVVVGEPVDLLLPSQHLKKSLLYALYGEDINSMLVKTFNVSLGSKGDGYYKKTNYQAWTFTYGVGQPLRNGFSPIVVLVMTIMVAVLLLVFMIAGIICCVKKWKKNNLQESVVGAGAPYTRLEQ